MLKMFKFKLLLMAGLVYTNSNALSEPKKTGAPSFPNIGRPATALEIKAWDIDVRPDLKGLPQGSGTVLKGTQIWEDKCASCHGSFGESNHMLNPLIGGTTKDDIKTGKVARLTDTAYPVRTTLMKVATISTLWDYINRAMPWNAPKSLTPDEVYSVIAYMLNTADIVPDDYVLSHGTMAKTQLLMPNRNGMSTTHAMWPDAKLKGVSRADVQAIRCMNDCAGTPAVASSIPDFALNAHGNLIDQNRHIGPQRGQNTDPNATLKSIKRAVSFEAVSSPKAEQSLILASQTSQMLKDNNCNACHGMDTKLIGPSFKEIAAKYSKKDFAEYLEGKIKNGGSGVWGAIAMPAQTISDDNAKLLARWLTQ
jgi:S-disulfanyl-L-cysteine oxidoreductase SoxD